MLLTFGSVISSFSDEYLWPEFLENALLRKGSILKMLKLAAAAPVAKTFRLFLL